MPSRALDIPTGRNNIILRSKQTKSQTLCLFDSTSLRKLPKQITVKMFLGRIQQVIEVEDGASRRGMRPRRVACHEEKEVSHTSPPVGGVEGNQVTRESRAVSSRQMSALASRVLVARGSSG
jgi:hypothetical protein